ncbi:MAG: ferrochelatase [Alphaproteobacteria bacterium]|nr:ferrochelatase [Alphaproteobacteria bacterium]
MSKTAIILFNLGGPDAPQAVRPFLFNLFRDPAILRIPAPFRQLLAWLIARRREKTAQTIYAQIGGGSPILKNTQAQAKALEQALSGTGEVKCFVSMRYWHPFSHEILKDIEAFRPDSIVMLPLYPQFSTTTTASSLHNFWATVQAEDGDLHARWGELKTRTICCYPEEPGFIRALVELTRTAYEKAKPHGRPRVLFSAHGLPEKIVQAGDPYPWQCEQTVRAVVREFNIPGLDWILCYQSRVGPLTWIGPSTDEEIRRAGLDKVPLVIVPVAFVSEHSETLVELDMECRAMAGRVGVPFYIRVPAVGTHPGFIGGLANLVQKALVSEENCLSAAGGRICPRGYKGCGMAP